MTDIAGPRAFARRRGVRRGLGASAIALMLCTAVAALLGLVVPGLAQSALAAPVSFWGVPVQTPPASVPIVYPRPAIAGTPAAGSSLACLSGVPAGSPAQLAYVWLRDTQPIAGATSASYIVRATDEEHHLQCRVTATDAAGSADATSAFVTIPFEGLPLVAGETVVGKAFVSGGRVVVPVVCSKEALHGCRLLLRLARIGARGRAVLLGVTHARAARGERRFLSIVLHPDVRRLLARAQRPVVELTVGGTVVGAIEGPLSSQRLTPRASQAVFAIDLGPTGSDPAATPYMGWDTYFAFGPDYGESTVLEQAGRLITLGLQGDGYRYVWLDVGWWQGQRAADGQIVVNPQQWPHGIAWLARTLHAAGLRLGLYTDAGSDGCGGVGQGSYGHYQQDADTFAAWGVDAMKVDFCGGSRLHLDPAHAYRAFREALDHAAKRRPMLLSICNFLQPGEYGEGEPPFAQSAFDSFAFGPQVGNSWRTDGDVGVPGHVPFAHVLRNLDADAAHPEVAGLDRWNDPDYLGPDQGMGVQQFRTQMSMWAMLAAPLMVSADLGRISRASIATLDDREVIAIDQDPLGVQGTLVSSQGEAQVWVKPLSDGSRAVALLNRGRTVMRIETNAHAVGLAVVPRYAVRNVWRHRTTTSRGMIAAEVAGDGTVLLRVQRLGR